MLVLKWSMDPYTQWFSTMLFSAVTRRDPLGCSLYPGQVLAK